MAEFISCTTCEALTLPGEPVKIHAADHLHTDRRIDALTRANTGYLQEIARLRSEIAGYGRQLEQHPISMDPETITVSKAPDYNDADLDVYLDVSEAEDPEVVGSKPVDLADYTSGMPAEYPLAIDRPDEPVQDAISNLYTPRNLI